MSITSTETAGVQTVTAFIDAINRGDVVAMVELCSLNADFHYIPFEMWGKQRVVRADGKVRTIGRPLWQGRADAFPDLVYTVDRITDGGDHLAVEATVRGTQAATWGVMAARGGSYAGHHVLLISVDSDGLITNVREYWDNSSMFQQLGHLEVD